MSYHRPHARFAWPFQSGQAVYWWPYRGLHGPRPFHSGVVTRVTGIYITVQLDDGRRRTVDAHYVVYRAYCPACETPAVADNGLRCPRCGRTAEAAPPPEPLVRRWFPGGFLHSLWLREVVLTGCTWQEARDRLRDGRVEASAPPRPAPASHHVDPEDDYLQYLLRRSPTVSLPVRPADDAEPDGEDALTRWVEQQFKRKAA